MLSVEVIRPGIYSSIQDGGRYGAAFYGVPNSGFMDADSGRLANILVDNDPDAPCIEMTYTACHLQFSAPGIIAIAGADMSFALDGQAIELNTSYVVKAGSVLLGQSARNGVRSYLAIQGEWQVKSQFGSTASYALAGLGAIDGRPLKKGDKFLITNTKATETFQTVQLKQEQKWSADKEIKLRRGPEHHFLESALLGQSFVVSPQSNRMASVLSGPKVDINIPAVFNSKIIFPGIIQCTPSGRLMVVLQDGQTTGGYPRVGIIDKSDLNVFNQYRIGDSFVFV